MKETQAKQFKPGLRVRFGNMDQLEGRVEFTVHTNRGVGDNSGNMDNGAVPVLVWHLLLCEVGAVHLDKNTPGTFNENVGAMYFVGGFNDLGFVVVCPLEALAPNDFAIRVEVKLER